MTAVATLSSTNCALCARPLTDAVSIATGIGPDCRGLYGYDAAMAVLSNDDRVEVTFRIHAIAANKIEREELRNGLFKLNQLGFPMVAERIRRRCYAKLREQLSFTPAVPQPAPIVFGKVDVPFTLTADQERARECVQRVRMAAGHSRAFIVGYAGTGKTTALKVFAQEHGSLQVITPTGRAALRVREATGIPATTIHRWLYEPKENEKTGAVMFVRRKPGDIAVPPSGIVVIDEASMVGPDIWKDIISVCQQMDLKLVCVGDGFQLPPVQPPNAPPFSVLTPDFAAQLGAERIEMTEVVRQAQDSPVIRASIRLRQGEGVRALQELQRIDTAQLAHVVTTNYRCGGVTICHRNVTRMQLNAGVRMMLGIADEQPQPGEPFVVTKNAYEAGVVNGEQITFGGWDIVPEVYERVYDKYKGKEEQTRFGATKLGGQTQVVMSLEGLHGRLECGPRSIEIAGERWARYHSLYANDDLAPFVHANFGYAWTCHRGQGSEWPSVLVCVEPSVRFDEEEGRRWVYTAVTRSTKMTAYHLGRV